MNMKKLNFFLAFSNLVFPPLYIGFNTALKLLWLLCHGFAAVKLIQHLLNRFPYCASIGMFRAAISI